LFKKLRRRLWPSPFERYHFGLLKNSQKAGWTGAAMPAEAGEPAYTYTLGFWVNLGSPDIVISGHPYARHENDMLWEAFRQIKDGHLTPSENAPWPGWLEKGHWTWRQVHPSQWNTHNFGSGFWFNERQPDARPAPPAFQLVWPDSEGRLPWEAGYDDQFRAMQYAFYEPRKWDGPET